MRKLSQLNEDLLGGIQKKVMNGEERIEDKDRILRIDGKRYFLTDDVLSGLNEYDDGWCIGFHTLSPEEDGRLTSDNCSYGEDSWDLGEEYDYDVFGVQEYTKPLDEIVNDLIKRAPMDELVYPEIKEIAKKYIKELIYGNHMSELARYNIYQIWRSDWKTEGNVLYTIFGVNDTVDTILPDSENYTDYPDLNIIVLSFPAIDDHWTTRFREEITEEFKKLGWKRCSEEDEDNIGDPYETPGETMTIAFVDISDTDIPMEDEEEE